jgi:hypothetical protein
MSVFIERLKPAMDQMRVAKISFEYKLDGSNGKVKNQMAGRCRKSFTTAESEEMEAEGKYYRMRICLKGGQSLRRQQSQGINK